MKGRVAIVGWGSLIWDPDNLAPRLAGAWRMGAGPRLPLEFSRVSAKRLGALAVCIDEAAGVPCATHAVLSAREDADAARADLARRERAPLARIGLFCARTGRAEGPAAQAAAAWAEENGLAGAVWTGLESNFLEETGAPFTLERAEAHLRALTGDSRREAVRYIENAPRWTDTPLRRRLAGRDWWRAEAARLSGEDQRR